LHRVDERVPLSDQVGELSALQREGKIEHIGPSEVSVTQLDAISD
jgi:aryl-alcohol dehydrogenase-like predicted oxidoreductase